MKKIDRGEFLPYINGQYVNPYAPKQYDPTIRKEKLSHEVNSDKRRFKTSTVDSHRN